MTELEQAIDVLFRLPCDIVCTEKRAWFRVSGVYGAVYQGSGETAAAAILNAWKLFKNGIDHRELIADSEAPEDLVR